MATQLTLPERLDGPAAQKLTSALAEASGSPLCLNGAEVIFGGALGLQFLVAAHRQWQKDQNDFEVAAASEALMESCRILGVEPGDIGIGEKTGTPT